ncbi:hypothetical protein [Methylobacterium sp. E-046]|uniref:hypothetical protein n=1 Tax=Methylobacterium sp. E-046 TaxID=2836576 RepID=UPI001FB99387|nr:hypothetical protein [Methylobacterium sp. E-046]MCJ2100157.1 hypothetical protein [Methylobacterium sp. E-046]
MRLMRSADQRASGIVGRGNLHDPHPTAGGTVSKGQDQEALGSVLIRMFDARALATAMTILNRFAGKLVE